MAAAAAGGALAGSTLPGSPAKRGRLLWGGSGSGSGTTIIDGNRGTSGGTAASGGSARQAEAAGTGASRNLHSDQVLRLWQASMAAVGGPMWLVPGRWRAFGAQQGFTTLLGQPAGSLDMLGIQRMAMGDPAHIVQQAVQLQRNSHVDWEVHVQHLAVAAGLQVEVDPPTSRLVRSGGAREHLQEMRLALRALVRLPAASAQPALAQMPVVQVMTCSGLDCCEVLISGSGSTTCVSHAWANRQAPEAAALGVAMSMRSGDPRPAGIIGADEHARQRADLQARAEPMLWACLAGLLRWQLPWQLPAAQLHLLSDAASFGLLPAPACSGFVRVTPSLGLSSMAITPGDNQRRRQPQPELQLQQEQEQQTL